MFHAILDKSNNSKQLQWINIKAKLACIDSEKR